MRNIEVKLLIGAVVGAILVLIVILMARTCDIENLPVTGDIALEDFLELDKVEEPKTVKVKFPEEYQSFIDRYCDFYNVPEWIVYGIISVESRWKVSVVNKNSNGSYDVGLGQLNSNYLDYYIEKFWNEPVDFNPENGYHNMYIVIRQLDWLKGLHTSWEDVIKAYHIGNTALKNGDKPNTAELYFQKVLKEVL